MIGEIGATGQDLIPHQEIRQLAPGLGRLGDAALIVPAKLNVINPYTQKTVFEQAFFYFS